MFKDLLDAKVNVRITARERGKRVPQLCREGHNIWGNQGRQYLAEVISPLNSSFDAHYNDAVVQYMGLGVGGDSQLAATVSTYSGMDTDYPGQNSYSDETITVSYLERPVKISGTAGVGASAGVWMNAVAAPPAHTGSPVTKVEFETLFDAADLHLGVAYPAVPLAEVGLFLSNAVASRTSEEVYDYVTGPAYINASTRQKLIAYNTFETIVKTPSVALEVHWEIQF